MSQTGVTNVDSRSDEYTAKWEITVTRVPGSFRLAGAPHAADLPEDVRAGLLTWLGVPDLDREKLQRVDDLLRTITDTEDVGDGGDTGPLLATIARNVLSGVKARHELNDVLGAGRDLPGVGPS